MEQIKRYLEERYEELAVLSEKKEYLTLLVKERGSSRLLVKKELSFRQGEIYQKLQELCHPNLVPVCQVIFLEDKSIVYQEYISGRTLAEVLEEQEDGLSEQQAKRYFLQLLEGLAAIHKLHVIHRDLKPENILVSTDGVVKLLDFGIARSIKEDQKKDTRILGTVGYASPEQFGFAQTDVRTDIYAAGILLNKMLTGRLPDERQPASENWRSIIARCTAIDPGRRYQDVGQLRKAVGCERKPEAEGTGEEIGGAYGLRRKDRTFVPGFRSNRRWKQVAASVGYTLMVLASIVYLADASAGGPEAVLLELVAVLMYIWLPVLLVADFLRWDRRIPGIRALPLEAKAMLRVCLCLAVFYFGVMLDNYVRYSMLGLPRPGK